MNRGAAGSWREHDRLVVPPREGPAREAELEGAGLVVRCGRHPVGALLETSGPSAEAVLGSPELLRIQSLCLNQGT